MKFSITKTNANEFIYSLVADIETPTPYNISLKKTSSENYRMILIGIIALIIIIIILFILIKMNILLIVIIIAAFVGSILTFSLALVWGRF